MIASPNSSASERSCRNISRGSIVRLQACTPHSPHRRDSRKPQRTHRRSLQRLTLRRAGPTSPPLRPRPRPRANDTRPSSPLQTHRRRPDHEALPQSPQKNSSNNIESHRQLLSRTCERGACSISRPHSSYSASSSRFSTSQSVPARVEPSGPRINAIGSTALPGSDGTSPLCSTPGCPKRFHSNFVRELRVHRIVRRSSRIARRDIRGAYKIFWLNNHGLARSSRYC